MKSIETATDVKTILRNESIEANPNHPLIPLTKKAFWQCFDWINKVKPEEKYSFLQVAISNGDEEISTAAACAYIESCKEITRLNANSVAKALIFIRQCAFSGYSPPRENRPDRFIEIFDTAFPRFSIVAPKLAQDTKRQALRDPRDGR